MSTHKPSDTVSQNALLERSHPQKKEKETNRRNKPVGSNMGSIYYKLGN
jgi:hypothetical protein